MEGIFLGKGETAVFLPFSRANRHGLIAGATGTGKTITLQLLAEGFSRAGVPVVVTDVKGDLAGMAFPGADKAPFIKRAQELGLTSYEGQAFPVIFWDALGEQGHPLRATVSDVGPLLLSRLLELSEAQEGALNVAFRWADEQGLLVLDFKDLQALLQHLTTHRDAMAGMSVPSTSLGAIQRRLVVLQQQGVERFLGEPMLDVHDLMLTAPDGRGAVNILSCDKLFQYPRLYATVLLWLLAELYENLPEVGDLPKPKLVLFFDEAHVIFEDAPRVLIANANLVPRWATAEEFRRLEALGLTMYGQMTAGSWIYIGTQGILQGTYETFAAAARKHFGGSLKGKLVVTAGLGGMGGAQPLAATMNEGTFLAAEVDEARIDKRLATGYLDEMFHDLDAAIDRALELKAKGEARSVGVVANAADLLRRLLERNVVPDVLTDQTSAHDELNGYVPNCMSYQEALQLRASDPQRYIQEAYRTMAEHMRAMLELQRRGAVTFDYGNNLRGQALKAGVENAFEVSGFVPLYIRPLFCEGEGPFRWVALSGDPQDILVTDQALMDAFPEKTRMVR